MDIIKRLKLNWVLYAIFFSYAYLIFIFLVGGEFLLTSTELTQILGYLALNTFFWSTLIGLRSLVARFYPDHYGLIRLHRLFGILSLSLILLHFVILFFKRLEFDVNLLTLGWADQFSLAVNIGIIVLILCLSVVTTSVVLRRFFSFRLWKRAHFLTYTFFFLSYYHASHLARADQLENGIVILFQLQLIILILAFITRALTQFGVITTKVKLTDNQKIAKSVAQLMVKRMDGKQIKVKVGQYFYIRRDWKSEAHPFTVSHINEDYICFSIKSIGGFSDELIKLKKDTLLYLEGPYGDFTQSVQNSNKPIILIAGGIGITPFWEFINLFISNKLSSKRMLLFYGNRSVSDAAYISDLNGFDEDSDKFHLINVMSEQEDYEGEKGFITLDILKKYAGENLYDYEFLLCGPPIMVDKLTAELSDYGVDRSQLHTESFGY